MGSLLPFLAAFGGFLAFGGFFFWLGLQLIPLGHRALAVDLGQQNLERYFEAGWKWYWPQPYGALLIVNCQNDNLDIDVKEVLTSDQVPVGVKISVAYNRGADWREDNPQVIAKALYDYDITEDAEKQLKQEAEDQLRTAVAQYSVTVLHQEKSAVAKSVHGGTQRSRNNPDSHEDDGADSIIHEQITNGICSDVKKFGLHVQSVQVTDIRLPPEIEKAKAKIATEEAEKTAERVELEGNLYAIDQYMKQGLTAEQAAIVHQAERGKVTREVKTVQGIDLAGLGAGLGGALTKIIEKKGE